MKKKINKINLKKKRFSCTCFFSVFNWPPPNTIEHTWTFFGQMFYCFFIKIQEKCIFCYFNFFLTSFCWSVRPLNICVTRNFYLMKIQKQDFQTRKNSKKAQKYKNKYPSKKISLLILCKRYWYSLFHKVFVIHKSKLML